MSESEALVRLQQTDIELMRLHRTLDAMPQAAKLAAIAKAQRKLQSQLTLIIGQRKDAEMDVAENQRKHEETLAKIQDVQVEAAQRQASFREARDVEAHLTALAKQQEKLEHAYLEKAETLDKATRAEKNARDLAAKLDAEKAATQESFERDSADLRAEVRKLEAERKQAEAEITVDVLDCYEKASKRFGGLAVEYLRGNVPSVCRVKLPPADFGKLSRGPEITECPYCHRILVTREF